MASHRESFPCPITVQVGRSHSGKGGWTGVRILAEDLSNDLEGIGLSSKGGILKEFELRDVRLKFRFREVTVGKENKRVGHESTVKYWSTPALKRTLWTSHGKLGRGW